MTPDTPEDVSSHESESGSEHSSNPSPEAPPLESHFTFGQFNSLKLEVVGDGGRDARMRRAFFYMASVMAFLICTNQVGCVTGAIRQQMLRDDSASCHIKLLQVC